MSDLSGGDNPTSNPIEWPFADCGWLGVVVVTAIGTGWAFLIGMCIPP